MARPKTGQTPPISFRPPQQLLKDFDATIEDGRSRSDVLIELMHDRIDRKRREQEKLRRERELLLTTFEPSASDVTIDQPFTDPGTVSVKDDPEQTAAWIDKMQKEAAEYWRGTEPPERPVSGEEQTA